MASLYVAIDESQMLSILRDQTLRKEWFGHGYWAMIPVKRSTDAAQIGHLRAVGGPPAYILHLTMPFHIFYDMVDSGVMLPCLHIDGYRVYQDLVLDTANGWDWAVHPVAA